MKKTYLLLVTVLTFATGSFAQLTGTKNIPGDYATLAAAITDLNTQGVGVGGVTLNLVAGNPQTAPAGGYIIGGAGSNMLITGTNPSSAANPVTITGNGNTITASGALTVGNLNDAIIKLKGADWVTIQGFTLQENAANAVIVAATNNMTEWGVALVYNSTTDGCQNNTIQNNTITLNRLYGNSFGIYSSSEHVDGPTSANVTTIAAIANNTTGPFNNNKVYSNTVSNVNYGIVFIGASVTAANMDTGNDVGGSSAATANALTNWGGLAKLTAYPSMTGNNAGIGFWNQTSLNIAYNTVTSASVSVTTLSHFGIIVNYTNANPTGTFTNSITNNTVTVTVTSTGTGGITGINCPQTTVANVAGLTLNVTNNTVTAQLSGATSTGAVGVIGCSIAAGTVNINNNTLLNCSSAANAATAFLEGIITYTTTSNTVGMGTLTISGNTLRGFSSGTAGTVNVAMIDQNSTILTAANITNNNIGDATAGAFTGSTANGGFVMGIRNLYATNAATINITGNTIRGVSLVSANTAGFNGIANLLGAGPTPNVTAGIVNISNNNLGVATIGGGLVSFSATQSIAVAGITNQTGVAGAGRSLTISGNSIRGVLYSGTGNAFTGIGNTFNWGAGSITISNNNLGTGDNGTTGSLVKFTNAQSAAFLGISNTAGTGSTLSISGNNFQGVNYNAASTGSFICINTGAATYGSQTINNNVFNNLSINTSAAISGFLIACSNNTPINTVTGNSITTQFINNNTTSASSCFGIYNLGSPASGTSNVSNNNLSNITLKASTGVRVIIWEVGTGAACTHNLTINSNTISNITNLGTGYLYGLQADYGNTNTISNNVVSGFNGNGQTIGLLSAGTSSTAGVHTVRNNTIYNINAATATSQAQGMQIAMSRNQDIYKNKIYDITSTGSGNAYGLIDAHSTAGITSNIYNNYVGRIYAPNCIYLNAVVGIDLASTAANTTNVYYNTVYLDGNVPFNSMCFTTESSTPTANIRNNIFANNCTAAGAYEQMAIFSTRASLTATYATTSNNNNLWCGTPGALHLIYADGALGALTNKQQTLAAFQTYATPRDALSISVLPDFTSTTGSSSSYLHLNTDDNCSVDGAGNNSGILLADDYDGDTRSTINPFATDIGADEFTSTFLLTITNPPAVCFPNTVDITAASVVAGSTSGATVTYYDTDGVTVMTTLQASSISISGIYYIKYVKGSCISTQPVTVAINGGGTLAGISGTAVCSNAPVGSGAYYSDGSCFLIARVVPSGASPVAGNINACVTLDATQQYFNAEPYVQRHFDIEPAVNPLTATSTLTLYFTDLEFQTYNSNNPLWPKLPTVAGGGNADPRRANARFTQFHGTPTTTPSKPGFYTGPGYAYIDPVDANIVWNGSYWAITIDNTGFSGFYLHTSIYFAPLAVSVNYFRGTRQGTSHLLDWKVTCNSTPSVTMTLERSASSTGGFTDINTISATAARCNQPFSYTDAQPLAGMNYYRLKMVDADGKISYSGVVALLNAVKGFEIMNIAPNPVTGGSFKLNVASAQSTKLNIVISDMMGRIVSTQTTSLISGYNSIDMNVSNLASGTYNIYGTTADDKSKVMRFVKQ